MTARLLYLSLLVCLWLPIETIRPISISTAAGAHAAAALSEKTELLGPSGFIGGRGDLVGSEG